MFRAAVLAAFLALPASVHAVGFNDDDPPTPTPTTTQCPDGAVYDPETEECVVIEESRLDDDALYDAVRELAYAGRLGDALRAVRRMSDQTDTRVQTYLGFIARRQGDGARALIHYAAALEADPDNVLARSYLGQAHVAAGRMDMARQQLLEIRARGAEGSWPDRALAGAIETGLLTDY